MNGFTTWREVRAQLSDHGLETLEKIRRLTAPERHRWRRDRALEAAEAWLKGSEYEDEPLAPKALCYLEFLGLFGGHPGNPGCSTHRHWAFRGLGKGRRKAWDGGAWTAAIYAAAHSEGASHEFGTLSGYGVVLFSRDYDREAFFRIPTLLAGGSTDPAILEAVPHAVENVCYHAYHGWKDLAGEDLLEKLDAVALTLDSSRVARPSSAR